MNEKGITLIEVLLIISIIAILISLIPNGISQNSKVLTWGGEMTVNLQPGKKLEYWVPEGSSIWMTTRDARPDEVPETHRAMEKSRMGWFEGTIIFIEHLKENK